MKPKTKEGIMRREVETISEGRCIIPDIDGTAIIVADADLGAKLRELDGIPVTAIKTRKPRKPRVRKALGKGIEGGQASDA